MAIDRSRLRITILLSLLFTAEFELSDNNKGKDVPIGVKKNISLHLIFVTNYDCPAALLEPFFCLFIGQLKLFLKPLFYFFISQQSLQF